MIELRALREKYVEMKALREAHAAGDPDDPRPRLRLLAARFPGALREIDRLPMSTIDARIAALDLALDRGAPERWMIELARYHAWMRFALRVRRACAHERTLVHARRLVLVIEHESDIDPRAVDDATLRLILRPPGGRLHRAILAHVAAELGASPAQIDALLS